MPQTCHASQLPGAARGDARAPPGWLGSNPALVLLRLWHLAELALRCRLFLSLPFEHERGAAAVPVDLVGVTVQLSCWEAAPPKTGAATRVVVWGQPQPAGTLQAPPAAPPRPGGITLGFPLAEASHPDGTWDGAGGLCPWVVSGPAEDPWCCNSHRQLMEPMGEWGHGAGASPSDTRQGHPRLKVQTGPGQSRGPGALCPLDNPPVCSPGSGAGPQPGSHPRGFGQGAGAEWSTESFFFLAFLFPLLLAIPAV